MAKVNAKLKVDFPHPVKAFALLQGGWLPVNLSGASVILLDRNITSTLKQIGLCKDRGDQEAAKWWLSFLNSPDYSLNPLLSAMESPLKRAPTFQEFVQEFQQEAKILKGKLPQCNVIQYNDASYKAAYALLFEQAYALAKESKFLVEVMPLISNRVSDKGTIETEGIVTESALNNGLDPYSLVVLAALSCLYDEKSGKRPSIGRKLLKPKPIYEMADAYNALSDLRCLHILNGMIVLRGRTVALMTRDKALAAFWCAIKPKNQRFLPHDGYTCDVELSSDLLPRLALDERDSLKSRLDCLKKECIN